MSNFGRLSSLLLVGTISCGGENMESAIGGDTGTTGVEGGVEVTTDAAVASDVGGEVSMGADGSTSVPTDASITVDGSVDAPTETSVSTGFTHPGILVNGPQLAFVKAKIAGGAEPWTSALAAAKASSSASLTFSPNAIADVVCGPYSDPDIGCDDEKDSAIAAYTDALLWMLTDDESYAAKSASILDAWSSTITEHTDSNAPLESAWVGSIFPRAGEILRATYPKWPAANVARFAAMLENVYLPEVVNGSGSNGNWELSMSEATIAIGVFLDDRATFDAGVALWRRRVPAYIYMTSDGSLPTPPPVGGDGSSTADLEKYWYGETTFVDGVCQETCRDEGHVQLGFAAMINAAETARIQGVDLYSEQADRLVAGLEFNAQYLAGAAVPSWLCGGTIASDTPTEMWEIAFNALSGRLGRSMPNTASVIDIVRPTGTNHHMVFETLTHAEVGSVGLP